jgi:hypothetical protein
MKVINIIGAGHSGSTLLNLILGQHPDIFGAGELIRLHQSAWHDNPKSKAYTNQYCACGERARECPFWTKVKTSWLNMYAESNCELVNNYIQLKERYEDSSIVRRAILGRLGYQGEDYHTYQQLTANIYSAIFDVSQSRFLVDSSKPPLRAYHLARNPALELYLIHLIRDGRGVVWSLKKGKKKDPYAGILRERSPIPSWRTTVSWLRVNLECEWVLSCLPLERVLHVSYEDLVFETEITLGRIGSLIGLDLSQIARDVVSGETLTPDHIVSGNRMRMKKKITLSPDFEWRSQLSPADARLFWLIAGWLARRYGYYREHN